MRLTVHAMVLMFMMIVMMPVMMATTEALTVRSRRAEAPSQADNLI